MTLKPSWTSEYWTNYWRDKSELIADQAEVSYDEYIAALLALLDDVDDTIVADEGMVLEKFVGPDGVKMARLKAWIVIEEDTIIDSRQVE